MNDPGLDEPIADAATQAHDTVSKLRENEGNHTLPNSQPDVMATTTPTRWWYASTAFPLVAGTFGPMANAFSVCALVENWRVEVPPGGTEQHGIDIRDPRWLIAVNSVSLAFALIANLSLLMNMAKRIRFEIAQPITILGFWSASLLLIGLIGYASSTAFHQPGVNQQARTQAYYYAIFAAGLYQIISYMMCVTVWGAYRGAYPKNFELTVAQRTLMLQTISFLVYLLVGALIYSHVEDWKYLDAVYFMDFTLLTVGIGDYSPVTHLGRSLLFPIAVGGIISIGLVISSIRTLVVERGAEKMSARVTEKTRRRVVQQIDVINKHDKGLRNPLARLNTDTAKSLATDPVDDHMGELQRRKTEFEAMRSVQDMAAKEGKYISLLVSAAAFAFLWFIGALVFQHAENGQQWTYFMSLYFSYTSILTIGYGDLYPMSNSGKPFFVFWSLLAVPSLTILISSMGDTVVKGIKDLTIWLGEISVLPSNDSRLRDRIEKGAYRATLGKFTFVKDKLDEEKAAAKRKDVNEQWSGYRALHPGLIKIFGETDTSRINPNDLRTLDRLAQAWTDNEIEGEDEARDHHDRRAQAEHHYRHLLISHIPQVYADTKLKSPKKYSYAEWTFYLKLIGEDESDSQSHRRAKPRSEVHAKHSTNAGHSERKEEPLSMEATAGQSNDNTAQTRSKWSWIGPNSPLMQDDDESEWILNRLFERLENSLRTQSHEAQHACSQSAPSDSSQEHREK